MSRLLEAWKNAHGGEETACPWSQLPKEISMYWEKIYRPSFRKQYWNGIYIIYRNNDDPIYVEISFVAKAKSYFAEGQQGVVTYQGNFTVKTHPTVDSPRR